MNEYVVYECHQGRTHWRVRLQDDGQLHITRGDSPPRSFTVEADVAREIVERFPRRALESGYSVADSPITLGWGRVGHEPATISPWPDEPAYYQFLEDITGVVASKVSVELMPSMAPQPNSEGVPLDRQVRAWRAGVDLKLTLLGLFVMVGLPYGVMLLAAVILALVGVGAAMISGALVAVIFIVGGLLLFVLAFASYHWAGRVIGELGARMSRDGVFHATLCAVIVCVVQAVIGLCSYPEHIVLTLGVTLVLDALLIYLVRRGSREGISRAMIPYF